MDRECLCGPENLVLYGEGDVVSITTKGAGSLLLVSGKTIGEPGPGTAPS